MFTKGECYKILIGMGFSRKQANRFSDSLKNQIERIVIDKEEEKIEIKEVEMNTFDKEE